jgi:YD repeat-containing protein
VNLRCFFLVVLVLFVLTAIAFSQVAAPILGRPAGVATFDADPIDLGTGLYYRTYLDLKVDDTIPIEFARTQRNMDPKVRSFGIGGMTSYDMWIIGDGDNFTWVALVMPDGSQERFERTSRGRGYADGVFVDSTTSTEFRDAQITWVENHWSVKLTNGKEYSVQGCNQQSKPGQCAVTEIRRNDNVLKVYRDSQGNIVRIVSPHGHSVRVKTDSDGKIIYVGDDAGHYIVYSYNSLGELIKAMNWKGDVQRFSYDVAMNISDLEEQSPARGNEPASDFKLHNDYDVFGRTTHQVLSTGATYDVSYVNGEHKKNRSATVKTQSGTTTTSFENGRAVEVLYAGKPVNWKLELHRDPLTGAIQRGGLQCANGRQGAVPVEIVRLVRTFSGDVQREAFSRLCTAKLN